MNILISGSLAYDYIMTFPDSFKHHIMPDSIHMLNVSFVVDQLRKNLGGTAGNIAYTMKLLGMKPLMVSTLGNDGGEYRKFWKQHGLLDTYVKTIPEVSTASAHITTDKEDNQISAFYVGALQESEAQSVYNVQEQVKLAIIAPTKKEAMIRHAKECAEKNIPIVFDPGQQATALTKQELMLLIGQAKFLIGNDYEIKLIQEKTGWDTEEIMNHVEVLIITFGEKGSVVKTKDALVEIPSCPVLSVDDPTGAGDAYRAGFFTGYVKGMDWLTCGRMGAVAASYAVEKYGTQNHVFTKKEFEQRYKEAFEVDVVLV